MEKGGKLRLRERNQCSGQRSSRIRDLRGLGRSWEANRAKSRVNVDSGRDCWKSRFGFFKPIRD